MLVMANQSVDNGYWWVMVSQELNTIDGLYFAALMVGFWVVFDQDVCASRHDVELDTSHCISREYIVQITIKLYLIIGVTVITLLSGLVKTLKQTFSK